MFHLTQYVIVRRDMPLLDISVQAGHAIGKAMFCYAAKLANEGHAEAKWPTLNRDWGHPSRILRGSKNEGRLRKLAGQLTARGIEFVTITEPDDGPLKGQMTALALFPGEKAALGPLLNEFQDLRLENIPAFTSLFPGGIAPQRESARLVQIQPGEPSTPT